MWARVVEVMLACWLAASPFVFGHDADDRALWATDFVGALAVATFALLSFSPKLRRAHLGQLAVAGWLVGTGWVGSPEPAHENHVAVGLLLLMLGIVPSEATKPHPSWRRRWGMEEERRA